jgi:hypothetical protein
MPSPHGARAGLLAVIPPRRVRDYPEPTLTRSGVAGALGAVRTERALRLPRSLEPEPRVAHDGQPR